MLLSKQTLSQITSESAETPLPETLNLAERVLQFGTGVLLRGLPDYFINKANAKGIFNGRVVVVKSTAGGDAEAFPAQDNLYTICIRGLGEGNSVKENIISSAISRVLSAHSEWEKVLECAVNSKIKIIISNTTEAGIELVEENINQSPPKSFPAKLLAVLYKRYQFFKGSPDAGMVIIPTELIPENGKKLAQIVNKLAAFNSLEANFINWLSVSNYFCNSLVDRIVPGKPSPRALVEIEQGLGYKDDLLICAEPYKLWAIEAPEKLKPILSFYAADEGIIIKENIDKYRELKLRLLNGTHSFCCGYAFLKGFKTVRETMADGHFMQFIRGLIFDEIAPAIPYDIPVEEKERFAQQVLDRFANPTIEHKWLSISLSYTAKMKMRNKDLIVNYYKLFNKVPLHFAKGFAAYLKFMKPVKVEGDKYFGEFQDEYYVINDSQASYFFKLWDSCSPEDMVREVLQNEELWGYNLDSLPEFSDAVIENLPKDLA